MSVWSSNSTPTSFSHLVVAVSTVPADLVPAAACHMATAAVLLNTLVALGALPGVASEPCPVPDPAVRALPGNRTRAISVIQS